MAVVKKRYFKIYLRDFPFLFIFLVVTAQGLRQGNAYQLHDNVVFEMNHCNKAECNLK